MNARARHTHRDSQNLRTMIHVLVFRRQLVVFFLVLPVVLLVEIQNSDYVGAAAGCTNPEHQLNMYVLCVLDRHMTVYYGDSVTRGIAHYRRMYVLDRWMSE